MRIAGLIFDLGSTLIHTPQALSWALTLNRMRGELLAYLQSAGYDLDPAAFLARFAENMRAYDEQRQADWVEYTTAYLLNTTLADLGAPPLAPAVMAPAVAAYYRASESLWQPVPGVHAALQQLAALGFRLGLISNAGDAGNVHRLIDAAALRAYFDPIVISAAVGLRKPNPRIFQLVLDAWQLPPARGAMIGDTLGADILGAQLAGLRNVWVSGHADHPANVAHRGSIIPEAEIPSVTELPALLERWATAT